MKVAMMSGVVCGVVGFWLGRLNDSPGQEESEKLEEWLDQLPKEALLLIGPRQLPEKYLEKLEE